MTTTIEWVSAPSLATLPESSENWLWDEYLAPGMVTLLTSRWKAGKTTLLSILLSKLNGGTLAGQTVTAASARVLTEEPLSLWKSRSQRLNLPASVVLSCRPFVGPPSADEWLAIIQNLLADPPDLVVLDPLAMFLPANVENNASSLLGALAPLHRLTERNTAVLLVHHPRKEKSGEAFSPRGSGALTGFADILLDLDRPHDAASERIRRLRCNSRLRPSSVRLIELTEDGRDYKLLPTPPDREGFDAGWPLLEMVIEDSNVRPTRGHLLKSWPDDFEKPSRNTLIRWLEEAERRGLIERRGTGRKSDAFRYALKNQRFVLDDIEPLAPLSEVLFGKRRK